MKTKKYICLSLLLLLATLPAFPQGVSLITGTWQGMRTDKVCLFKVENGALVETASSVLNAKREFGFVLHADSPGFYSVGVSPQREAFNYAFYLKPGDNLSVAVEGNTYSLTGTNTPENREMERWHNLVNPLEVHAYYSTNSTYVEFFPLLDKVSAQARDYAPEYSADPEFVNKFRAYRSQDLMHMAVKFLFMPRSAHPQDEDMTEYYNTVSLAAISADDAILDYPYGQSLLRLVRMHAATTASKGISEDAKKSFYSLYACLDRDLPQIANARLKGEAVLSAVPSIRTFEGLQDLEAEYGKYLATDGQKERFKQALIDKATNAKGQDAFDFKFKDVNGKEVALSDFKGKVVYVDVWATWCAPCRKEFPFLKELEKDYKGKNVVFIGVSSDAVKDYDKWVKFLKDNSMEGIQLFAGEKRDDIMKPYKINAIPHFLLFGKDGKIVSSAAPRPSSSEIRPLLNGLLKK